MHLRLAAISAGVTAAVSSLVFGPVSPQTQSASFDKTVRTIVTNFCVPCHSGPTPAASLHLDKAKSEQDLALALSDWQRVSRVLRAGTMPPKGKPAPNTNQKLAAADFIDATLASATKDSTRVTMRRLTKVEYKNTIRDLVGIEFNGVEEFPNDDIGYGFDNIGDVLSVSTLLVEKYLAAAEAIATQAIVVPKPTSKSYDGDLLQATDDLPYASDGARSLFKAGSAYAVHNFESNRNYTISVIAYAQQAGPDLAKMDIRIDGVRVGSFDVAATPGKPLKYELPVRVAAGKRRVEAAFVNDYYRPQEPNPAQRDRNLYVLSIEVSTSDSTLAQLPESHRRIIFTSPPQTQPVEAARQIIARFASRAFRRPATQPEVSRLLKVFDASQKTGAAFEQSIRNTIQAVLVSPNFLFKAEPNEKRPLTDYELATRLSYFLWSSMPDDELTNLAANNKLTQAVTLRPQIKRMLASPKAASLAENFGVQWLQLRKLEVANPDPKIFPHFNDKLRQAMLQESILFIKNLIQEDRTVIELLDADYTFVNGLLATHYGITGVTGSQFQKVKLTGSQRGGVMSQASVLTITSNPNRTSPVRRGKWILEQILGDPTPPPPPGAGTLPEEKKIIAGMTMRQRLDQHRTNPECASCHSRIDPLGFSLENYDAVGAWRTEDDGAPLDTTGTLPNGTKLKGIAELKKVLLQRKDEFARNLAEKLLTYALGRGTSPADRDAIQQILKTVKDNNYRMSSLLEAIILSEPFRNRTATGVNR